MIFSNEFGRHLPDSEAELVIESERIQADEESEAKDICEEVAQQLKMGQVSHIFV